MRCNVSYNATLMIRWICRSKQLAANSSKVSAMSNTPHCPEGSFAALPMINFELRCGVIVETCMDMQSLSPCVSHRDGQLLDVLYHPHQRRAWVLGFLPAPCRTPLHDIVLDVRLLLAHEACSGIINTSLLNEPLHIRNEWIEFHAVRCCRCAVAVRHCVRVSSSPMV